MSRMVWILLLALVSACFEDPIVEHGVEAMVYGVVTSSDGEAAAGVEVEGRAAAEPCEGVVPDVQTTTTDTSGRYRLRYAAIGGEFDACVTLFLRPAATSALRADTVSVGDVPFRTEGDSVRVDVVLEPLDSAGALSWVPLPAHPVPFRLPAP